MDLTYRKNTFSILLTLCLCAVGISVLSTTAVAESDNPDFELLGGDLTTATLGHDAIQVPAPSLKDQDLIESQLKGFATFHQSFRRKDGLGPQFINKSCRGCHVQNGKGPVRSRKEGSRRLSTVVVKTAITRPNGRQKVPAKLGAQLQDNHIKRPERDDRTVLIKWEKQKGKYPDRTRYRLRKPVVEVQLPFSLKRPLSTSLRMTPLLIGLGLLEAIPEEDILALSDPEDSNGDGISGKPNYVTDKATDSLQLGRFGFKASQPTLKQQNAVAAHLDMGVTSELLEGPAVPVELKDQELEDLTMYLALAGVPRAREQSNPLVRFGFELFKSSGCADCHVPSFVTESPVEALNNQKIYPFTDLLVHDMGPDLADDIIEGQATGSEWRTTPLWGLGFASTVSRVKPRYLHDGRARSIEEAILWHGGEAEAARENFKQLSLGERELLLKFLESL